MKNTIAGIAFAGCAVAALSLCADTPTPAVVICPGGGYGILAWNHEGVEVAQWL